MNVSEPERAVPTARATGSPTATLEAIRDDARTALLGRVPDSALGEPLDDTRVKYPRCADGNGTLTHLFFSEDPFDIGRAQAICRRCGLSTRCRAAALDRGEPCGVWGGAIIVDGVEVACKRGRGRPPKNASAAITIDEVPLPPTGCGLDRRPVHAKPA